MGWLPSLKPKQRLLLIPTTTVDTDWGLTEATDLVATTVASTESVRLRPSPRLPLIPTTTVDTDTEATVRGPTEATDLVATTVASTESVRLRLSPRLPLILLLRWIRIRRLRSEDLWRLRTWWLLRGWIRIRRLRSEVLWSWIRIRRTLPWKVRNR